MSIAGDLLLPLASPASALVGVAATLLYTGKRDRRKATQERTDALNRRHRELISDLIADTDAYNRAAGGLITLAVGLKSPIAVGNHEQTEKYGTALKEYSTSIARAKLEINARATREAIDKMYDATTRIARAISDVVKLLPNTSTNDFAAAMGRYGRAANDVVDDLLELQIVARDDLRDEDAKY